MVKTVFSCHMGGNDCPSGQWSLSPSSDACDHSVPTSRPSLATFEQNRQLCVWIFLYYVVFLFLKDFFYTEKVGVSELKLVIRTSLFKKEGRKQYFYEIYKKKPADLCFVPSLYC